MNTDAQSAGPPKLDQPQHNHSTAKSRSRRSRNHARGSLGSLGLASLFACCFVPFSPRWLEIRVAALLTSLGWASRRPKLCITRLGLAARSSARVPAGARCWLQMLASFGAAWSGLTVRICLQPRSGLASFGARCRSVGPREVRLLGAVRGFSQVLVAFRRGWQRLRPFS
jgi:hypothetical protein